MKNLILFVFLGLAVACTQENQPKDAEYFNNNPEELTSEIERCKKMGFSEGKDDPICKIVMNLNKSSIWENYTEKGKPPKILDKPPGM